MDNRIEISTVEIIETHRSSNHPFRRDWSGQLLANGEKVPFSADMEFEEGEQYCVVLEHTEPVPGERLVEIHQRVTDEQHHT